MKQIIHNKSGIGRLIFYQIPDFSVIAAFLSLNILSHHFFKLV